ncbi:MAG: helix-turn-helix domain-containing protein [Tannerellaceae bacterium]|nr:helix-turn-helix domain-containing protein [Tannerellaceae bacterium]MCD8177966.1 helix-turn-helix domain-containing protein [Tannerellaceae bacterium]
MTQIDEYVIARVKAMRQERGWSQQELADYMNFSQSFIRDVENPKKAQKYNLSHINELCKIFDCTFADFFPDKPL